MPEGRARTTLPMLRWSSARDCERRAILEATREPDRDYSRLERGWLWRGRRIGQDYALFVAYDHGWKLWVETGGHEWVPPDLRAQQPGDAHLTAELPIRWPLGVGHADLLIHETMTLVEVLSSAHADRLIDGKLLQLAGYLRYYPDARNGALVVIDPSSMAETDRVLLHRDSKTFHNLLQEVEERVARLRQSLDTDTLPPRVCRRPAEARAHFCRHADTCFQGWQPPDPPATDDADAYWAAVQFQTAKAVELDAKAVYDQAVAERKAAQDRLADHPVQPGDTLVGNLLVKRTPVSGRTTFDWRKAAAGFPGDFREAFAPCFKVGDPYETWKVTAADTAGDIDYGEAPF